MRTARRTWVLLLSAALAAGPAPRALAFTNNTAGSAAEFLRLGAGARALGMGEAFGPVAEGADGLYWNPGALAWLKRPEISYTHVEMLRFFHHDHISYAHPFGQRGGTVGASATFFYQDKLDLVDNAGQEVGKFGIHSEAFTLAYARVFSIGEDYAKDDQEYFQQLWYHPGAIRPLSRPMDIWAGNMATGLAVKYVGETIHDRRAQTIAVDGGISYFPTQLPALRMSFVFRNVGGRLRFIRESENLPSEVALGVAYDVRWADSRFVPALEASVPYYGDPSGKLGLEYSFRSWEEGTVAFRAGYKSLSVPDLGALSGLTGGIGVTHREWSFDLGFQPMADLGQVYRLTMGRRF